MRAPTLQTVILHCLLAGTLVACATNDDLPATVQALDTRVLDLNEAGPLIKAVQQEDMAAFRRALASGARINGIHEGATAFGLALKQGQFRMAEVLLKAGADWRLGVAEGDASALIKVADQGQNTLVKQLILRGASIDYRDANGKTALIAAAQKGHLTTMKVLLNAGADANAVADGKSVLMHVVANNNALLSQVLIKSGADVNYTDEDGDTALKIARRNGYFDIDLMLVQAGARF